MPRLVRSEISFFLITIESIAGLISKASLALKYVSSLFDSNARRGRLIVTEPNVIEVVEVFSSILIPVVEHTPFENMTLPPMEITSDNIFDTLEMIPLS